MPSQRQTPPTTPQDIAAAMTAIDDYAKTASYFVEYPEDIEMFGVSFNTLLGNTGWALQGEFSYHDDAPLQREDKSIITEGLYPVLARLALVSPPFDQSLATPRWASRWLYKAGCGPDSNDWYQDIRVGIGCG